MRYLICHLFRDHENRHVGIGTHESRHDRRINYPQVFDSEYPAIRIDDDATIAAASHATCTAHMVRWARSAHGKRTQCLGIEQQSPRIELRLSKESPAKGPRSKRQRDAISSNPVPEVAPPHGLDQGRIRQEELVRQLSHSIVAKDFEAQLQTRDEPREIALIRKQIEFHLRRDSRIGSAEAYLTARMGLMYLNEERRDSASEGMPGGSVDGGEPNVNTGALYSR